MKKILTMTQQQLPQLIGGLVGLTLVGLLLPGSEMDITIYLMVLIFSYPLLDFAVSCNTSRKQLVKLGIGSTLLTSVFILAVLMIYILIFKCQLTIITAKITGPVDYLYFFFLTVTAQLTSLVINMDSRIGYWSKSRRRAMEIIVVVSSIAIAFIHAFLSAIINDIAVGVIIIILFLILIRSLVMKFSELIRLVDFTPEYQFKSWMRNE